jgi:hypothetical protein
VIRGADTTSDLARRLKRMPAMSAAAPPPEEHLDDEIARLNALLAQALWLADTLHDEQQAVDSPCEPVARTLEGAIAA